MSIDLTKLSPINFPRPLNLSHERGEMNINLLSTLAAAFLTGLPGAKMSKDFMVSAFAPNVFNDDQAPEILGMTPQQKKFWEENREHPEFGAEIGINGQMSMPLWCEPKDQEEPYQVSAGNTEKSATIDFIFATYRLFENFLVRKAAEMTPTYRLYQADDYKLNDLVTIRRQDNSEVLALVRHIFPDLQCDNDATIYDMIVTPVGSSRLVRVHSIDILPLSYEKSLREIAESRATQKQEEMPFRQDVLVELMRMLPKQRHPDLNQMERKIPQNTAQGIMGFGAAPKR